MLLTTASVVRILPKYCQTSGLQFNYQFTSPVFFPGKDPLFITFTLSHCLSFLPAIGLLLVVKLAIPNNDIDNIDNFDTNVNRLASPHIIIVLTANLNNFINSRSSFVKQNHNLRTKLSVATVVFLGYITIIERHSRPIIKSWFCVPPSCATCAAAVAPDPWRAVQGSFECIISEISI